MISHNNLFDDKIFNILLGLLNILSYYKIPQRINRINMVNYNIFYLTMAN